MIDIEDILSDFNDFGYSYTDSLSLAYHTVAANKLRNGPMLLRKLEERNANLMKNDKISGSYIYFQELSEIIKSGLESIISKFLERSDDGQLMRSCSPAVAIISQDERIEILSLWKKKHNEKLSASIIHKILK